MVKLTKQEKELWYKYKIPGCSNITRIKRDVVFYNRGNLVRHELAKAVGALQLMIYGEVTFNEKVIEALKIIEEESIRKDNDFHSIVTEGQECKKEGLRRDLIDLTSGEIYEFETGKRGQRHPNNINVIYV